MVKVPDEIQLGNLARKAAGALATAGFEHRIDIFRDVEVEDPVIRKILGQKHGVRVRITITAQSLLLGQPAKVAPNNVVPLPQKPQNAQRAETRTAARAANAATANAAVKRVGS
ncbi:MAG TPA: hypothetical protein VGM15_05160 [Burkholderiaceae bacterium]|jgi:hypothetical protein